MHIYTSIKETNKRYQEKRYLSDSCAPNAKGLCLNYPSLPVTTQTNSKSQLNHQKNSNPTEEKNFRQKGQFQLAEIKILEKIIQESNICKA